MNVYPVNAMEAGIFKSGQKEPYSRFDDLYNKYIGYQVDFNSHDVEITVTWAQGVEVDAVILGNTNAVSCDLLLTNNDVPVLLEHAEITRYINIVDILDADKLLKKERLNKMVIMLHGDENIRIGYLFAGVTWALPRFIVNPNASLEIRSESGRTFSGQVTGIPSETLKSFACSFARVTNKDAKIFDNYVNSVQTIIPHVVDPYPKAHEDIEPFFATVEEYSEREKRDENGFYWNFDMSWQEAK